MNFNFLKSFIADITSKIAQENYKKILLKSYKRKIKVVFHLYDKAKWKCQALYESFLKDEAFEVEILISKYYSKDKNNVNQQKNSEVIENYNYFKNKGLNVELAYDIKENKYIPLDKFKPDIVIYQHPWGINKTQHPYFCSKFALCYYIPYSVYPFNLEIEYNLDFYKYLFRYCVLNHKTAKYYSSKTKLKNLAALGNPWFDNYNILNYDNQHIIYAPHWAILSQGNCFGTFEWSGKFILEFAKQNRHFNWVFKPHPLLKNSLIKTGFMSVDEVEKYFNDWKEIGSICDNEDYIELFNSSKMMITDCGSFLAEYFLTKKPLIRLVTSKSSELCAEINKNYYQAKNLEELKKYLSEILINNNDYMLNQRIKVVDNLDFIKQNASGLILEDIKNEFQINN